MSGEKETAVAVKPNDNNSNARPANTDQLDRVTKYVTIGAGLMTMGFMGLTIANAVMGRPKDAADAALNAFKSITGR
jgi:hypothetical protein